MVKARYIVLGFVIILVVIGYAFLYVIGSAVDLSGANPQAQKEKVDRESEQAFADLRRATDEALATRDLKKCEQSPISTETFSEFELGGIATSIHELRSQCYTAFMRKFHDPAACEAIRTMDINEANRRKIGVNQEGVWFCFEYLADLVQEPSYCERADSPPHTELKPRCLARAERKIEPCYQISKWASTTSKYSQDVAECVTDVAIRRKEGSICSTINGSDYGPNWATEKNLCLLVTASEQTFPSWRENSAFCDTLEPADTKFTKEGCKKTSIENYLMEQGYGQYAYPSKYLPSSL